jgi:hypothetical protein
MVQVRKCQNTTCPHGENGQPKILLGAWRNRKYCCHDCWYVQYYRTHPKKNGGIKKFRPPQEKRTYYSYKQILGVSVEKYTKAIEQRLKEIYDR